MNIFTLGNDEQIHHFEGKNPMGSCRVNNNSFTEESDAPPPQVIESSPIDISPHHLQAELEQQLLEQVIPQCWVKRIIMKIFRSDKRSEQRTIIVMKISGVINIAGPIIEKQINIYN